MMQSADLLNTISGTANSTGTEPPTTRFKVFMLAFACGPGRGSEPGQGWRFATGMAEHHDVWVLAYSGFRNVIEKELGARPRAGLNIAYYHLPFEHRRHWQEGIDRHGLAEQFHYYFWNLAAARVARAMHGKIRFDLVHHVSFMRYWSPSAASAVDAPFLWGPIGGGESAPRAFYRSFGWKGRLFENIRDLVRYLAHFDPFVRQTARRATLTLATTEQSAERIRQLGARNVKVGGSVALTTEETERLGNLLLPDPGPVRFVSVGRLLHWKGYDFGLRAFAQAVQASSDGSLDNAEYWIIGDGPDRGRMEALSEKLGLKERVFFTGHLERSEVLARLAQMHVLVHPSFHDSGGYATLECMAAGRPVICLALGGPGVQVTPECGYAVQALSPEQVVLELSEAMRRLSSDPETRKRMSDKARERVAHSFSWDRLIDDVREQYEELVPSARFVTKTDA